MVPINDVSSVRSLGAEEMGIVKGGIGRGGYSLPVVASRNPHFDEAYVLKANARMRTYLYYDAARVSKLEVSYKLWQPVRLSSVYSVKLAAERA